MGNTHSQDQEALWRKKQGYYDRIATETANPNTTAEFKKPRISKNANMLSLVKSGSSVDSEKSGLSRRADDQREFNQQSGCFSWFRTSTGSSFADKPFKDQLKDKRWLTNLIKGLNKYSKLQVAFKEIARYIKSQRNEFNQK